MLLKGSNIALNDPKKVLLMIHDVPRYFFKIKEWGLPNFCYRAKMGLQKVEGGCKKPNKYPNYLTKTA